MCGGREVFVVAESEWKIFFEGDFWYHSGRDHAGKELRTEKEFEWAGHEWRIPAVYSCGKGLVIDFCMRADRDALRAFMEEWELPGEPGGERSKEEMMKMERDNPLILDFKPHIFCNGKKLRCCRSCSVSYQPYLEGIQDMGEAKAAMEHYGLSSDCGWTVTRAFFKWSTKRRPGIKAMSLVMEQRPVQVPGSRFTADRAGDSVYIARPESDTGYTLIVREYEHRVMEEIYAVRDGREYPRHFDVMGYTVEPEPEAVRLTLQDSAEGEPARKKPEEKEDFFEPIVCCSSSCIALAGGKDAVFEGENGALRMDWACSAMHFEPAAYVEWIPVFHIKQFEDRTERLV